MHDLELDLQNTLTLISDYWPRQNNADDRATNFIYSSPTLQDCLNKIDMYKVNKNYALHRWYNFMTSIKCEYIFCEYGAVHDNDPYNRDIDIYINSVPFDVKLTVYPAKLSELAIDLNSREGKDYLIRWYYRNQSQQSRKQLINRMYVVCAGNNVKENMAMKSNFELMRERISKYMKSLETEKINELEISDGGKIYNVKSDIVLLN